MRAFTDTMARRIALGAYLALIGLTLLWEAWAAPSYPPRFWLSVKAVPLLFPLFGLLHGQPYTYAWASMLIVAYFMEGVVVAFSHWRESLALHHALPWALAEIALTVVFFAAAIAYVRLSARRE